MDKPPSLPNNGRRASSVSLSPHKARRALKAPLIVPVRAREKRAPSQLNFDVALSKNETVLVTGSGDVLVCRCRYTSKAYKAPKRELGQKKRDDESSAEFWSECSACNPCGIPEEGGLLGGAPPQFDVPIDPKPPGNDATELKNDSVDAPEKDDVGEPASTTDANVANEQRVPGARSTTPADDAAASESKTDDEDNEDDLAVLPSFDYSFFSGENNDMNPSPSHEMERIEEEVQAMTVQEDKRQVQPEVQVAAPHLTHGVPTFLRSFHQVKITQVSANPLGSHVLLISKEALLFSFGLNNHGQLGHGYQSPIKGPSTGFVTKPSIVTPLLENGGKAVVCSAGVDYSLVVVKTEGKRIERLHQPRNRSAPHRRGSSETHLPIHMERVSSLPSRIQEESDALNRESPDDYVESMSHYQLYGFGRNDGRKLGLVEPSKRKKGEDVLVPRRVALSCNVWPGMEQSDNDLPPPGIFAVAASAHHSAALVRRASGSIELYTWGDASFNALGPVVESGTNSKEKGKNSRINGGFTPLPIAVTVPTVVPQLSYSASNESLNGKGIIPVQVALGPTSTFVITSKGKVLSFGTSDTGLLGQGHGVVVTDKPGQVVFPSTGNRTETRISSISVGPSHAVAVASNGRVYAWGKNEDGKMGFDGALTKHLTRGVRRGNPGGREKQKSPTGATIEWIPREVELPSPEAKVSRKKWIRRKSTEKETAPPSIGAPPLSGDSGKDRVVRACAGIDMTVFVKESGEVFSCGTSSGRLGLGESGSSSVATPTPMFGGLKLWR